MFQLRPGQATSSQAALVHRRAASCFKHCEVAPSAAVADWPWGQATHGLTAPGPLLFVLTCLVPFSFPLMILPTQKSTQAASKKDTAIQGAALLHGGHALLMPSASRRQKLAEGMTPRNHSVMVSFKGTPGFIPFPHSPVSTSKETIVAWP